ncbi:MAG: hypothetical protein E7208_11320 [Clostridium butyricum]|nr:hypothetical protein [Clostridium butyricum]
MDKKQYKSSNNIDAVDNFDTFSFVESDKPVFPSGKCIAEFNFEDVELDPIVLNNQCESITTKNEISNRTNSNFNQYAYFLNNMNIPSCHGGIPSIDNEIPDTRRCYVLRSSTVRKINEIKNNHSSLNVCVSTIVDLAVSHYYDCIKN